MKYFNWKSSHLDCFKGTKCVKTFQKGAVCITTVDCLLVAWYTVFHSKGLCSVTQFENLEVY